MADTGLSSEQTTRCCFMTALRQLVAMIMQSPDIRPAAEQVWFDLIRCAPSPKKFSMMADTTRMMRDALMAGLRMRHAGLSDEELQRFFAEAWLGHELAAKAYGPMPAKA